MDDRYQDYDDFTVLVQPGLEDLSIPRKFANLFGIYKTFLPDLSYLAPDCFHPSQKLHALRELTKLYFSFPGYFIRFRQGKHKKF